MTKSTKIRITQIKSAGGHKYDQRQTLEALGIKRMNQTVEKQDTPAIRGMIRKVVHLIKVSEA